MDTDGPNSIALQRVFDNLESAVTHLENGDLLVFTIPEGVPAHMVAEFRRHAGPMIQRLREEAKRDFAVLVLTGGVQAEVLRAGDGGSLYWRLAKDQIGFRTELNELKATVAKLINK